MARLCSERLIQSETFEPATPRPQNSQMQTQDCQSGRKRSLPTRRFSSLDDFVASATRPTEEIFLVDSLDNVATTAADELCRFIQQGFGTRELDPVEHGWYFYFCFRLGSYVA
jgi:hypothetical protein